MELSRPAELLVRFLELRDIVRDDERQLINQLPFRIHTFESDEEIVAEGSRPTNSCLIVKGYACRSHVLEEGTRQLAALHIPGDFVDLHSLTLRKMDHSVTALGECEVAFVPHEALIKLTNEAPHLTRLLWLCTTIDAAVARAWITAGGRLAADGKIAHLLCEIYTKLRTMGFVEKPSFILPARQSDIADMSGMSVVHVNRTIQKLRAARLLKWDGYEIQIKNLEGLMSLAQFDPTYLSLQQEPR